MLEFLMDFIGNNVLIVLLCATALVIASVYSKGVKIFSFYLFAIGISYYIFSCLYRQGLGIDILYNCSSKCVFVLCNQKDCLQYLCLNNTFISTKLFDNTFSYTIMNLVFYLISIVLVISFMVLAIEYILPQVKKNKFRKTELYSADLNKNQFIYNTINSIQPKFILNSVLRC